MPIEGGAGKAELELESLDTCAASRTFAGVPGVVTPQLLEIES